MNVVRRMDGGGRGDKHAYKGAIIESGFTTMSTIPICRAARHPYTVIIYYCRSLLVSPAYLLASRY